MRMKLVVSGGSIAAAVSVAVGFAFHGDEPKRTVPAKPTYAEHVAPILNEHCIQCHRPGEVAPFSLVGYENAKKWSAMSTKVTHGKQMPPWKATLGYGEFKDTNLLSEDEIAIIKNWDATGALRGNAKAEPKPPVFTSDWALGQPDLIVSQAKPYQISPEGTDEYRNFIIKTNYTKPMWIKSMDVRPGNRKVVHHVICYLDNTGQSERLAAAATDGKEGYVTFGGIGFLPSGSLGGWAPGLRSRMLPEGRAFKLEPGARIVMQVHYNKSGKSEVDQTKVGVYFAKEPITREVKLDWLFKIALRIPAGENEHKEVYRQVVPEDVTLYGVMPHMHLLGRAMKAWVEKPDGSVIPLIHVQDWDFNWQLNYLYKEPLRIPKGSKIVVEGIYDNSSGNPANPNKPPKTVFVGEKTTDEMMLLIAAYSVDGQLVKN
jgi:hypothetical protein